MEVGRHTLYWSANGAKINDNKCVGNSETSKEGDIVYDACFTRNEKFNSITKG